MTMVEIDNTSRKKIIEEIDKNFFVIANAGSGKTSILVNRMVAMVEKGVDVSKICAITFTKNAAAEFLDRFQEKLRERSVASNDYVAQYPGDLGTPNDITRDNCIKALLNINLCFLGTIDSFCNKALSEFPVDANIPSSSVVIDNDEKFMLYKKEYEKISRDKESPLYEKFRDFLSLNNDAEEVFSRSIIDVIEASTFDIVYDKPTDTLENVFKKIKNKYENLVRNDILKIIDAYDIPDSTGNNKEKFRDSHKKFCNNENSMLKRWTKENFVDVILNIEKNLKKSSDNTYELRFSSDLETDIIRFIPNTKNTWFSYGPKNDDGENEFINLINLVKEIKYSFSIDFLSSVSKEVTKSLRESGKLTFTDYLLIFRELILKDMDNGMHIINHIKNKYSYFLIDESQDTSPLQTEVFLYLSSMEKAKKVCECKPRPGSLFILGDPKQSIYRFRGADVNSYMNTKELFMNVFDSNNEVLMLTKNFRSTINLIDYFNDVFKDLANYEQIPSESAIDGNSGLYTFTNYIDVIRTMLGNDDYKVCAKENGKKALRAPMYKDFMIITKSKKKMYQVIKELNDNHIPTYIEGVIDVSKCEAVESVYAIYKYVISNDTQSLYNLLTSPIFGVSAYDVIGIDNGNIPSEIKPYLDIIDTLKEEKNPLVLYEKILDNIKLLNRIDYSNLDYAYYVLESLKDAYSKSIITNLYDALLFVEKFIKTYPERVMSLSYKPNAVYLANLHKVKGLEAPIVLLLKAGVKATNNSTFRIDYKENKSYIFKTDEIEYSNGNKKWNIVTSKYKVEESFEDSEASNEEYRLKYVAATRARSYLFIDNSAKTSFWSYLVNDSFKEFVVDNDREFKQEHVDNSNICNSVVTSFDDTSSYVIKSPSKLESDRIHNIYSSDENDSTNFDARLKGTIVHRLMEILVSSNNSIDKTELIKKISNEYNIDKLDNKDTYINMLYDIYDTMTNGGYTQENGKSSDLLSILKDAECHCEVPFSYKDGSNIWYGNIDLLYIKDGKYFIVDYKTNLDGSNLEEKYKKQLEAYKLALKEILGVDATTYIYHIDIK